MKLDRKAIAEARVMVVGCGALGNEVLKNLALSGVGHIYCVDFDAVEESNLTRSVLFRREDAEKRSLKVDVTARRLREINPSFDVHTCGGDVAFGVGLGVIASMDVVVACVDSRWARFMIGRHCNRVSRPWVDGGISEWEGSVKVFIPGKNCYACSLTPEGISDIRRRMPCPNVVRKTVAGGGTPTSSILASIVGAVEAQEAMKLVCGLPSICGRVFSYEGDVMNVMMADFEAYDEDCPEHAAWTDVKDSPFTVSSTVGEVLSALGEGAEILLRDDCFVDYVEDRNSGEKMEVMLPGRKVGERILSRNRVPGRFYQNEYRTIGSAFPYGNLSLGELGVPAGDILETRVPGGRTYYRMGDSVC
ncbi:MAG: ThiF family adenylyltransferase [Bacteroidales bacterium]|nr:ThiF family adenylyltransferase [Bacteroidales bacterium]